MAAKPKFDPNKPFEVASTGAKPKFDPSKPFEAAPEKQEGMLDRFVNLFSSEGRKRATGEIAPQKSKANDILQTELEQFGNAASMGYLPQMQAAAQPAIFKGLNALTGREVEADEYVDSRDQNISRQNEMAKENPGAAALSTVAGVGANIAATPLPALGFLGKGILGAAAKSGAVGAAYSAAANPGDTAGKVDPLQLTERKDAAISGLKTGAALGGGLSAGAKAIKGAPAFGKKMMTTFLGPSGENIDYYLKNSKAVNSAKSIEELKGGVDDIVGKLRGDVEQGKMTLQEAKQALRQVEDQISATRRESGFQFQVAKTEINQTMRDAKKALETAINRRTQDLRSVRAPTELADDATVAVRDLQKKVSEESKKSYDILDKSTGTVSTDPPYLELIKAREGLKVQGQLPVTPAGRAAYKEISDLADSLFKLPKQITMSEAKQIIQQIDQSKTLLYNSGQWTSDVDAAFKGVRRALDQQLKTQSPEYAAQMERVANLTRLHEEASAFGDRGSALSKLNRVGSVTAAPEREALVKLGKETGRNYDEPVEKYIGAQRTLNDPREMERIRSGLPEFGQYQSAQKASRMLEGPEAQREFTERQLKSSGLLDREGSARGLLNQSEQGLIKSEAKLKPFSNISEGTSEGKIKGLLRAKPGEQVEIRKQFEELSKLSDTDFVKAIDDLRVNRAFRAGNRSGSRNVNLFAIVTGALGKAAGGAVGGAALAGPLGAGVGAVLGGVSDHFGPAIAKRILDGAIKLGDNPSVQKIKALKLPPEAENYLMREFMQYKEKSPGLIEKRADQTESIPITEGYEQ